jgi:hypothetical protein
VAWKIILVRTAIGLRGGLEFAILRVLGYAAHDGLPLLHTSLYKHFLVLFIVAKYNYIIR